MATKESKEVMKEKCEVKRGPGRPRKRDEEKENISGNIMSFVEINGRGSGRPRVVHSPPRKNGGESADNRRESVDNGGDRTRKNDTEGGVGKKEGEQVNSSEDERREEEEGAASIEYTNEKVESSKNGQSNREKEESKKD